MNKRKTLDSIESILPKNKAQTILAWGLIFPSFLFLSVFTLYPILHNIYGSFFSENLANIKPQFSGLKNYIVIFKDPVFIKCILNNIIVAVAMIPVTIALGTMMAQFTNKLKHGKSFFTFAFFYPVIIPMIAAANIWLFIYTPQYGLFGRIAENSNVLGSTKTVLAGIIIMLMWKQSGYLMVFYLSGLQNISKEIYEAARIDGAGPVVIFKNITWPLLRPITIFAFIISLTDAFKVVDYLYVMTNGGPANSSNMILFYIYQTGFDFWDIGKASAMTTVLVLILLALSALYFFHQDKRTFYS